MAFKNESEIHPKAITYAKELQSKFKLSDYEALSLALKTEQNEILEEQNNILSRGFVLSSTDKYPSGFEAIAIALGYKNSL